MNKYADLIIAEEQSASIHRAGTINNEALKRIENIISINIKNGVNNSLETGCGKTTVLFSNISTSHTVFCLDDTKEQNSSLDYLKNFKSFNEEKVEFILGPTQQTMPKYNLFKFYDCIFIDGPHAYPFPDLEYFFTYRFLTNKALLFIDDVQIPNIGNMFDFIKEDDMFIFLGLIGNTGVLQRSSANIFNHLGDDWAGQSYNQRRIDWFPNPHKRFKNDGKKIVRTAEIICNRDLYEKYQIY